MKKTGFHCRLLSEGEWEYAAPAGAVRLAANSPQTVECEDDLIASVGGAEAAAARQRLVAARQAVETAKAEVAGLEEDKRIAAEETDRILASATEKLRGSGQSVTEEEVVLLRAEVARAIRAADEAGRALADAQAALAAAEEEQAFAERACREN